MSAYLFEAQLRLAMNGGGARWVGRFAAEWLRKNKADISGVDFRCLHLTYLWSRLIQVSEILVHNVIEGANAGFIFFFLNP